MEETIKELQVTIKPKMIIEEETAMLCLKIVELFVNANRNYNFVIETEEDGSRSFRLEKAKGRTIYE